MITSWPEAILHLDADAFFASVTQAVRPELKGKPVVTGYERGIATAVSYEAKSLGITRGMRCWEIKKKFPEAIITSSDYKLYHLFSNKMFAIMKHYSPTIEIYSIDEGFVDLKGMRRPLHMSYEKIAQSIKTDIESSLAITVSIGVSVTKSLAKIAANLNKPSGLTMVPGREIDKLLKKTPVGKIWGVGMQTTAFLNKLRIKTAYEFASKPGEFIKKYFSKPFYEIWEELNGIPIYKVNPNLKREYKSITRSQTVTPATNNRDVLWARLMHHTEDAFLKARNYNYSVRRITIYLKDQRFNYHATEVKLTEPTPFPMLIRNALHEGFEKIYKRNILYRATGVTIHDFVENDSKQISLFFHNDSREKKAKKIYPLYDDKRVDFGTSLFDNDRIIKKRKQVKFSLPLLSEEFN